MPIAVEIHNYDSFKSTARTGRDSCDTWVIYEHYKSDDFLRKIENNEMFDKDELAFVKCVAEYNKYKFPFNLFFHGNPVSTYKRVLNREC